MRALGIGIFACCVALGAQERQRMSASELEQLLRANNRMPGAEVTSRVAHAELTERVPLERLPALETGCRGKDCRNALIALVDESQFVMPVTESAQDAPPEDEQKAIAARFLDFLKGTQHQMPNFIATRTTARFEDWPKGLQIGQEVSARRQPLALVAQTQATLTYRNGKEEAAESKKQTKGKTVDRGLSVRGLFGPMLTTVIVDSSKSTLKWSRWDGEGSERLAVFRFAVPMEKSTYEVTFCCIPTAGGLMLPVDRLSAYHGELAIHPADGSVARITLVADLDQGDVLILLSEALAGSPLSRADLAVEYGPVEIAGKQYMCPVRAVALSRARTLITDRSNGGRLGPVKTYLNDISFTDYHVFRSESRVLTDWKEP